MRNFKGPKNNNNINNGKSNHGNRVTFSVFMLNVECNFVWRVYILIFRLTGAVDDDDVDGGDVKRKCKSERHQNVNEHRNEKMNILSKIVGFLAFPMYTNLYIIAAMQRHYKC